jgi:flagellar protein FliL
MARKKKGDEAAPEGDEKPKKKGKGNLVPAVVLGVGLLGGGYFMGPGKSASANAEGEAGAETTTTTVQPGPVEVLEPITLNVQGGHYLKVSLALQMSYDYGQAKATGADESPAVKHAALLDAAIDVFGGATYDSLVTPVGREAAKKRLLEQVAKRYDGGLEDVYFTEFVLQ